MSKHEKTLRRTRRKTDAARRKEARTRAFRRTTSHIRHGAAALAAAAALAGGTVAYADQVRFGNPPHGDPGHFEWIGAFGDRVWMDITADAAGQPPPGPFNGPAGVEQRIFAGGYSLVNMQAPGGALQTGVGYPGYYQAIGVPGGELIPTAGTSWNPNAPSVYYGPWGSLIPEGIPSYLGVRFDLGAGLQYGWIGVVRQNTIELEAFAWGYETEPGVPIPAGAGGCANDAECDDGSVCTADSCDLSLGECVFEPVINCDDGDSCTIDSCDPITGECSSSFHCDEDACCQNPEEACVDGNCVVPSTFFTDQAEFEAFMLAQGKLQKTTETFEENDLDPGFVPVADPLEAGVPNGPFPTGLEALNLVVQSNTNPSDPSVPSPGDGMFLITLGAGFGETSDIVVSAIESLDLIFTDDNKTGVGFNTISFAGDLQVRVYDTDNALIGVAISPADSAGSNFLGIWSSVPIGRVNIVGGNPGGDNIQMWFQVPCEASEDCDDGNACTLDECDTESGSCSNADLNCDDGDLCTIDSCDPATGCSSVPITCDDGNACTVDECVEGQCTSSDLDCDDGNVCDGIESCDPVAGCQEGTPLECNDGNTCTADSCDPATGCVNDDIEQTLIVKHGACPAPVNPNSNGVIPMLLVGDAGFDVNNVDLGSLDLHRCDGAGGSATPLADQTKVKDLNHPGDGAACGECACNDDQSSDGIDDLSLKFRTDTTLAALGIGAGDGVVTVELTGTMMDGTPFCSRDCLVVVPPGSGPANATMQSNVPDTFIEMTPLDLNVDSDGFANFTRSFVEGTAITLTAPSTSDGRRFLRWSVNGELQGFGIRTIDVTVSTDLTLKAYYQRPSRVRPNRPSEGSGDME